MKCCHIGIIGAGRIGKLHAENIRRHLPQFKLLAIADPVIDVNWAKSLNIPFITSDWEELIEKKELDAILIASPSTLHIQQIIASSNANKAIFCEKPLGLTEAEIQQCLTIVEANNTFLQLGFNRRFDQHFASINQRAKEGEIGKIQLIRITSRDPECPPKEYIKHSGGLFFDMAIHDFDMARFLASSEVTEIYAEGGVFINPAFAEFDDIDTAVIQLRFKNGVIGVIDNSRQAIYGYDQRIEILGSKGTLLAHNQMQNNIKYYNQQDTRHANPVYFFLERYQNAYIAELQRFYESLTKHLPSPVNGNDGLQALRLAIAAKQSLKTNQPIRLN